MALTDGLNLICMIDGIAQATLTQVSVNMDNGAVDLETFEGFIGATSGVRKLEVSANWAVKLNGLEFDFATAIANKSYHDVQIPIGSKTLISRGYFKSGSVSRSVNAATEASASFVGTFDAPE
jgi:hypothetical protein